MASSLVDVLKRVSRAQRDRHGVDVGLENLIRELEGADPDVRAELARKGLTERLRGIEGARADLFRLVAVAGQVERDWPYSNEAWERRAVGFQRRLSEEPMKGLTTW